MSTHPKPARFRNSTGRMIQATALDDPDCADGE